ncbi:unnamed protein product, partial [Prorocentrum cordatum]
MCWRMRRMQDVWFHPGRVVLLSPVPLGSVQLKGKLTRSAYSPLASVLGFPLRRQSAQSMCGRQPG